MEITVPFWSFPTIITIISFGYAIFIHKGDGYMAGIDNLLLLVPAGIISTISWIVYAIFK